MDAYRKGLDAVDCSDLVVVFMAPWPWSHLYNRAQPLAAALARRGCRVIYIDPVERKRRRLSGMLRLIPLVFPHDRARVRRTANPRPNLHVAEIGSRRGRASEPWAADYSPAACVALERFLKRETRGAGRRYLVISRQPKLSVTRMLPWDHVTFDIEDPWFEHPWGGHPFVSLSVRRAFARADLSIANGYAVAEMFQKMSGKPIRVFPNGVERELLEALERVPSTPPEFSLGRNRWRILFTGRIDARIHFDLLASVLIDFPDIDFYFVGEAHIWPESRQSWGKLNSSGHVFHVPRVPHENIPKFLAHADAFLLPYGRWGSDRMFPGKLLEYLAAGRPIFVTRHYREVADATDAVVVYENADELRAALAEARRRDFKLSDETVKVCHDFVWRNTWEYRVDTLLRHWETKG